MNAVIALSTTRNYNKAKKQKTADVTLRFAWTRSARTVVTPGEPMDAKNKSKERCCSFA